jgi:glucokinase
MVVKGVIRLMEAAAGVDIGGTKIKFALVDRSGTLVYQELVPTEAHLGAEQVMDKVLAGIGRLIAAASEGNTAAKPDVSAEGDIASWPGGRFRIAGIGIGSAGQIDFRTGEVAYAVDTLPGWTGTPIKRLVEERFGLPVYVDNDVNVMAAAEQLYGTGRQLRSFVCLALGTGIGGAVVEAGRLIRGAFGGAGELGHVSVDFNGPRCSCGNYGCIELYASGTGIARLASESAAAGGYDAAKWGGGSNGVMNAWQHGDPQAERIVNLAIRALGTAVGGYIHAFNPQAVIVGGGIAAAGKPFFRALAQAVDERTSARMRETCRIVPAFAGGNAGVIGAAAQVWLYGA